MCEPAPGSNLPGRHAAVAAGFGVLFASTGVNFAFGMLFKSMLLDLGGRRSTLALAATASLLVNALGQPLIGSVVDRVGPRRVILVALSLMVLGTWLTADVTRPWQLVMLYGAVSGCGYAGSGILPVSVHITRWFPARRGFVMALAACGFSLGHLVFTQVAALAEALLGWRRTYRLLAVVLGLFLGGLAIWLRDAPARPGEALAARSSGKGLETGATRGRALASRGFWCTTAGLIGCGFTDFLLTTHLAPFTTDLGYSSAVAANAVSLWAAANIAGILLGGAVAARLGARRALVLTYLVRTGSLVFLLGVRETWQLYLFAGLFGATFFTTAPLSATLLGDLFGPAAQGFLFGVANLFHHSAGATGAYLGGLVFDRSGSYTTIFWASVVVVAGSTLVTAFARPRSPAS